MKRNLEGIIERMKKICFISVRNEDYKFERLLNSIRNLKVPDDCSISFLEASSEDGIASAYEEARQLSKAEINIYIDGNAEIIKDDFLYSLLDIYETDSEIAIVGVLGAGYIPTSGFANESSKIYGSYKNEDGRTKQGCDIDKKIIPVMCVEGFFMAIKGKISWRKDLFHGKAFYDTAQCMEYMRAGLKSVVIKEDEPWIKFERVGVEASYEEQQIFLDEYSKDIYPLVSVVIPTFQRPEYFELALKSVLAQTYRNLDIYITDNSHDNITAKLMEKYLKEDNRIKYEFYPEDSKEQNIARYYTYDNKNAEYVNYMMDDDLFAPEKIAKMMDFYLKDESIALVTSYRQLIDAEGNKIPDEKFSRPIAEETTLFDGKSAGRGILINYCNYIGEPTTPLIKKKYLNGRYKGWSGEEGRYNISDYPLWLRILQYGNMVYIREPLSYFRIHEGQSLNRRDITVFNAVTMAYEIQYAIHHNVYLTEEKDIRLAYLMWISLTSRILRELETIENELSAREKEDKGKIEDILCNMSLYINGKGTTAFDVDVSSEL